MWCTPLDEAGAQHSQSPITAEGGAVIQVSYTGNMAGNMAGNAALRVKRRNSGVSSACLLWPSKSGDPIVDGSQRDDVMHDGSRGRSNDGGPSAIGRPGPLEGAPKRGDRATATCGDICPQ
jgi:hypothetical protein